MDLSQFDNIDHASKLEIQQVIEQENQKAEFQKSKLPKITVSFP
jgi:hypothetical protein